MTLELTDKSQIRSAVLRMGLPAAFAMFVGTLYAPIDLWCAGRLGNEAVVAIAFAAPLFFVLMAFSSGLSQATTALMAKQLGAGETSGARVTWTHALALATLVGLVLSVLGWWGLSLVLEGQGARGSSLQLARGFSGVLFSGAAAFLLVATINSALVAEGDTKPNFWFLLVGCFINLFLNLLLMQRWGVAGIAASTVLVQLGGLLGLYTLARRRGWRLSGWASFKLTIFAALFRQAWPVVLNMLMIPVAVFLVMRQVAGFGQEAVAGYGFAARIEQLISMAMVGLVTPILPLASRARGAHHPGAAFRVWQTNLAIGFFTALVFAGLMATVGPLVCQYSGLSGEAVAHMQRYLIFAAMTLPAYPVLFSVVFFMQALGKPQYGMWMGLGRHCIAPLVLLPVFVGYWGLNGIWLAILVIAWAAAAFALYIGLRQRGHG
jgi:putative MATE family efflux protein